MRDPSKLLPSWPASVYKGTEGNSMKNIGKSMVPTSFEFFIFFKLKIGGWGSKSETFTIFGNDL